MLANHPVTVTVRPPPSHVPTAYKTQWTNAELLEQAEKTILQDLRALLEKDITERIVASQRDGEGDIYMGDTEQLLSTSWVVLPQDDWEMVDN